MFYLLLLAVAALGACVYLLLIFQLVPGAKEERLGVLQPLPDNVNVWQSDAESPAGKAALARGQMREERLFFVEASGRFAKGKLVHQVRLRNAVTKAIELVETDQPVKRRRIRGWRS